MFRSNEMVASKTTRFFIPLVKTLPLGVPTIPLKHFFFFLKADGVTRVAPVFYTCAGTEFCPQAQITTIDASNAVNENLSNYLHFLEGPKSTSSIATTGNKDSI